MYHQVKKKIPRLCELCRRAKDSRLCFSFARIFFLAWRGMLYHVISIIWFSGKCKLNFKHFFLTNPHLSSSRRACTSILRLAWSGWGGAVGSIFKFLGAELLGSPAGGGLGAKESPGLRGDSSWGCDAGISSSSSITWTSSNSSPLTWDSWNSSITWDSWNSSKGMESGISIASKVALQWQRRNGILRILYCLFFRSTHPPKHEWTWFQHVS